MADESIFRTRIASRDPRYPMIIHLCNYFLAGLFMGMFLILSGVMLTAYAEERQQASSPTMTMTTMSKPASAVAGSVVGGGGVGGNEDDDDRHRQKLSDKVWLANVMGVTLLIIGCILIGLAFLILIVASVMYLQTTTRPPEIEPSEDAWHYLDTLDHKRADQSIEMTDIDTDNQV